MLTKKQKDFLQLNIKGLALCLKNSCIGLELSKETKRLYNIEAIDLPFCRVWLNDALAEACLLGQDNLEALSGLKDDNAALLLFWLALAIDVFKQDLFYY